jgi:hypothetical protein
MSDELADLRARVARLEARESCVSTFNEYLHYLDGDYLDDLLGVFAPDAELIVVNFPPGSGENLHFDGRDEIRTLYAPHKGGIGRHHSANVTVVVADDAQSAELSAYFITSGPFGFGGGLYQIELTAGDPRWQFQRMHIVSTWGWVVPTDAEPYLAEHLGEGALRGGKPIVYGRKK